MIQNLKLKLSGELLVTREELFELVSSWGRYDKYDSKNYYFRTNENIEIEFNNPNVKCEDIFCDNLAFREKYLNINYPLNSNTSSFFIHWFKNNREQIKEINQGNKKEILDFFSFNSNTNKEIELCEKI